MEIERKNEDNWKKNFYSSVHFISIAMVTIHVCYDYILINRLTIEIMGYSDTSSFITK